MVAGFCWHSLFIVLNIHLSKLWWFITVNFVCSFHVMEWMSLAPHDMYHNSFLDREHDVPMLESCLTFLATLMTVRTNLGKSQNVIMTVNRRLEWNLLKVTCVLQVHYFQWTYSVVASFGVICAACQACAGSFPHCLPQRWGSPESAAVTLHFAVRDMHWIQLLQEVSL